MVKTFVRTNQLYHDVIFYDKEVTTPEPFDRPKESCRALTCRVLRGTNVSV